MQNGLRHVKTILRKQTTLRITTAVVIVCGAIFSAYYFWSRSQDSSITNREYVVSMHDGAFYPSGLTVILGDTVIFRNTGTVGTWPASDPHPTHEYLPSFDPKKNIEPGKSWSYTFLEPGNWRYHDHENPIAQGEINVLSKNSKAAVSSVKSGMCDGKCFDELVRKTVQEKGIDAAYKLFQDSYDAGTLPRSCHWTAHKIGEAAYELFKEGKDFNVTDATSYCAYGFYHGFMEGLLRDNPDPEYALSFCKKVEAKLGSMGLQNCYHGIGHGYTEDPPDPRVEGDFKAMIAPGTKMCEFLFGKDFRNLNLCLTGVFTVPAGFAADNKYGLSIDPKDPFAYCKDQPERYLKACYGEFAPKLDQIVDGDLSKIPAYVSKIKDERLKELVVWVVPSVIMARDITAKDHSKYIEKCRTGWQSPYREICWGGTILGFFSQGEPEREYVPALNFCASDAWKNETERRFCYGEAFREMRRTYSDDKIRTICSTIPGKYQDLCLDPKDIIRSPYTESFFNQPLDPTLYKN